MFRIAAPAGKPAPIVARHGAEPERILEGQEVRDPLLAQGAVATQASSDEAAAAIRAEHAKRPRVTRDGGIRPEWPVGREGPASAGPAVRAGRS